MKVIYNEFDFGLVRCDGYDIEAVYDPTGKDLLFHRIHLTISGEINPRMTSSGKDTINRPGGAYKVDGDDLGTALDKLKDQLMTPRQDLEVFVGSTQVIDCPGTYTNGELASQDPEGGPTPQHFRIREITGDKSARFSFSIIFAVTQCERYVLSNRWTQSSHIDSEGMSVRTTRGRTMLRADYLYDEGLTGDDFRKWLIIPCPPLMRRWSVECTVASDNTQVDYTIIDRQVGYGVGQLNFPDNADGSWPANRWGITRIEGTITTGYEVARDKRFGWAEGFGALADYTGEGTRYFRGGLDAIVRIGTVAMGQQMAPIARALVRVYSQPGIFNKQFLVNAALGIIYDRLKPAGISNLAGGLTISGTIKYISPCIGFSVTQDIGSDNAPYVQVHASYLCLNGIGLATMAYPQFSQLLQNLNTSFLIAYGGADTRALDGISSTPTLPFSNNTRGSWLGELFVAALNDRACTIPRKIGPVESAPNVGPAFNRLPESGYGINIVDEPKDIL